MCCCRGSQRGVVGPACSADRIAIARPGTGTEDLSVSGPAITVRRCRSRMVPVRRRIFQAKACHCTVRGGSGARAAALRVLSANLKQAAWAGRQRPSRCRFPSSLCSSSLHIDRFAGRKGYFGTNASENRGFRLDLNAARRWGPLPTKTTQIPNLPRTTCPGFRYHPPSLTHLIRSSRSENKPPVSAVSGGARANKLKCAGPPGPQMHLPGE